ncbi:MAG: 30S ribosomal protein S18 alanine N-acetyltransferase [Rhodospirillaceae bacterium]|nr:30S ribosomal protein S18 alanine N-acetyltransferase [Rhodospirillaceae bacterium]
MRRASMMRGTRTRSPSRPGRPAASRSSASRDDVLHGFALVRATLDEAEILTICTAPGVRRRGVGFAIVTAACAYCGGLGIQRLFLEVSVENAPALALYARAGFAVIGRRAGYYQPQDGGPPIDALVLALTLADQPLRISKR